MKAPVQTVATRRQRGATAVIHDMRAASDRAALSTFGSSLDLMLAGGGGPTVVQNLFSGADPVGQEHAARGLLHGADRLRLGGSRIPRHR